MFTRERTFGTEAAWTWRPATKDSSYERVSVVMPDEDDEDDGSSCVAAAAFLSRSAAAACSSSRSWRVACTRQRAAAAFSSAAAASATRALSRSRRAWASVLVDMMAGGDQPKRGAAKVPRVPE